MFDTRYEPVPRDLDRMKPGIELAAFLATIDVDRVSPHNRITVLRAHQRMRSHYDAHLYRDMTAVLDAIDESDTFGSVHDDAAAEIGSALGWTRRASDVELHFAIQLRNRLPRVWQAIASGVIDRRRAKLINDGTIHLPDAAARKVVEEIIDAAPRLTTGQLRARLEKLCIEADPADAKERYDYSVENRALVAEPTGDGTANLLGLNLPPHGVAAATRRVNRLARELGGGGDRRTMDQRRADVFIDLLTGSRHGGAGGAVEIQIPLDTLTGTGEAPGELNGYGPVVADIARQVAKQQRDGQWQWVVTDPETEQPIATGTTRRRPGAAMRRMIEVRDRTCIFPGCRMPATNCDLDHRVPWAQGGKTRACDLAALCRHHHIIRHHGWSHRPIPGGDYRWKSRLGHTYTISGVPP